MSLPAPPILTSRRAQYLGLAFWLLVLCTAGASILHKFQQGYQFDSNLLALLPATEQDPAQSLAAERLMGAADDQLLVIVGAKDAALSLNSAERVLRQLESSKLFARVEGPRKNQDLVGAQQFLERWRYQLLSPAQSQQLQRADVTLVNDALGRLYSPLAALIGPKLIQDPLQLHFLWQMQAMPKTPFEPRQNWLTRQIEGQSQRLIRVHLKYSPYAYGYQQQVADLLHQIRTEADSDTQVLASGLVLHAAYGARQARQEISTIGLGSALGILLLLGLCFARLRIILLAFLPLASGVLLALAISMQFFEKVHLITLAFGASLVGVAIDYPLHFFCARRETLAGDSPAQSLFRILPALSLGLASSIAAYSAQAMTPFPGLRQMALFSAVGLLGAWTTVICCLPLLTPHTTEPSRGFYGSLVTALCRWLRRWPTIEQGRCRWILVALVSVALVAAINMNRQDDLRLLQTSPPQLLEEDARVQNILGADHPGQYFVIRAQSAQLLLQRELSFSRELQRLQQQELIRGYNAVSSVILPAAMQEENLRLQRQQIYAEGGLLDLLAEKMGLPTFADQARSQFSQNSQASPLLPRQWLQQPAGEYHRRLWLGDVDGHYYSIIGLSGIQNEAALETLRALADTDTAVVFVNRADQISQVLATYRQQLTQWLLLAYALVMGLLIFRYGLNSWRVLAAPATASLVTLACLQWLGAPFTLFHALALLLILGIGLDASIFFTESRCSPHTWVAISLSSATTLLAFGLLALSSTPVLQFFGQTVFIGIISVWLFTPCFVTPTART
ncbi:hypothetical protein HBA55_31830 [Pseudomaricurvus alkylphenolicus]|uniref:MMPL family transporter n=1 Tax=Pseudomaricurvus alkylphenolicus TaxID=1306991 RepID=UPI0014224E76|nr:hypothetical protein [Pseudomaricurvus alkylphenolicus]NIB44233.1 hypothetical protein [Pseudomaricurvus alkylphenolicus]